MWNYVVKNFQVKHGQCDSIMFMLLYFGQVLESIHKFIKELYVLQCLFVRGYNKQQRRGRFISNFTKRTDFFTFYDNQVLLGVTSRCVCSSCTLQCLLLLFRLAQKRIYLNTQLKRELTNLFLKLLTWCSLFPQALQE